MDRWAWSVVVPFEIHRPDGIRGGAVNLVYANPQAPHRKEELLSCWECANDVELSLASRLLGQSAEAEIDTAFDAHKCVPLDSSQNALQVVREATDNK